jgi:endothelin-converting enzyme
LGVSSLISSGAGADDKDPDVVVVQVSPPYRIGLPAKDYYKDEGVIQRYESALSQVVDKLSRETDDENTMFHGMSKDLAHEVVEFEKKLADASPNAEDQDDVTKYYNPMPRKDADSLAPQIQLSTIINGLDPSDVKTNRLIVFSPQYLKTLSSVLDKTSREVLQIYFIWKVIQAYYSVLEADELKPYSRFINELQGKVCLSSPNVHLTINITGSRFEPGTLENMRWPR